MRKSGKTTKMVDHAIQILFKHGKIIFPTKHELKNRPEGVYGGGNGVSDKDFEVMIVDPDAYEHQSAQDYMKELIKKRLISEHKADYRNKEFEFHRNKIIYNEV